MTTEPISPLVPEPPAFLPKLDAPTLVVPISPNCRVETSFDGLEVLRDCWDEAVIRLGGSIYMSYDWCRTWWEFYGQGKELRILLFYSGENIVGIVPLYIDSVGFYQCRFRVVR